MSAVAEDRGPPLFVAMLCAPLIGVNPDDPTVLHAVTMDQVCHGWSGENPMDAACGAASVKLLAATTGPDARVVVVEWPPKIASLPAGHSRCRPCWEATGRKRPRSTWKAP